MSNDVGKQVVKKLKEKIDKLKSFKDWLHAYALSSSNKGIKEKAADFEETLAEIEQCFPAEEAEEDDEINSYDEGDKA